MKSELFLSTKFIKTKKRMTLDDLAVMIKRQFDHIDTRFTKIDGRFDKVEARLDRIESTMVTKDDLRRALK